jgi:hypothetical protein
MRVLALSVLAATLAVPTAYAQSASDDTAPEPETTDALFGATPTPVAEPEESMKDEWVDVIYSRSLGPFMDSQMFRFDARDAFSDESWLAVELRWNVPSNFLNEKLVRGGLGIAYERYTLRDFRQEHGMEVTTRARVHALMLRQYFVKRPGKALQPVFIIEAGPAFEFSSQHARNPETDTYMDLQERDRMLFRWGLAFGARYRPLHKMLVLNGEVRLPFYISRSITPGLQLTFGAGISY